ncbi:hypothetical protein ANCCAN_28765 [Ancylostoma caninum]|uniref:Transmembrane protein n=1 Tax=Ancylostoma caninum TaxID=29170 RepID=A0A368F0C3_ANCCA|nr:hypothetical protein ANCCAN_28765 [Ancylostoma caninum]
MEVSEENDQHTSQASGSGIIESEKIVVDGYSVISGKPTVSSWPTFKSNTWRNRLKRVRNSSSANNGAQVDEVCCFSYLFSAFYYCSLRFFLGLCLSLFLMRWILIFFQFFSYFLSALSHEFVAIVPHLFLFMFASIACGKATYFLLDEDLWA